LFELDLERRSVGKRKPKPLTQPKPKPSKPQTHLSPVQPSPPAHFSRGPVRSAQPSAHAPSPAPPLAQQPEPAHPGLRPRHPRARAQLTCPVGLPARARASARDPADLLAPLARTSSFLLQRAPNGPAEIPGRKSRRAPTARTPRISGSLLKTHPCSPCASPRPHSRHQTLAAAASALRAEQRSLRRRGRKAPLRQSPAGVAQRPRLDSRSTPRRPGARGALSFVPNAEHRRRRTPSSTSLHRLSFLLPGLGEAPHGFLFLFR